MPTNPEEALEQAKAGLKTLATEIFSQHFFAVIFFMNMNKVFGKSEKMSWLEFQCAVFVESEWIFFWKITLLRWKKMVSSNVELAFFNVDTSDRFFFHIHSCRTCRLEVLNLGHLGCLIVFRSIFFWYLTPEV